MINLVTLLSHAWGKVLFAVLLIAWSVKVGAVVI